MKFSFIAVKSLLLLVIALATAPLNLATAGDVSLDPGYVVGQVTMGNADAAFITKSISTNASGGGYTASKTTSNSSNYQLTVQGGDWNYNFTSSASFAGTSNSTGTSTSNFSTTFNNRTLQVDPGQAVSNDYINTGVIKFVLNISGEASTYFSSSTWSAQKNITTSEKTYTTWSVSNSSASHRSAYWYVPVVPNQGIAVSGNIYVYCSTGSRVFSFSETGIDVEPGETVEVPLDILFTCPPPSGGGGGSTPCTTKPFTVTGKVDLPGVQASDFYRTTRSGSYFSFTATTNPYNFSSTTNYCADTLTGYAYPTTSFIKTGTNAEGSLRWPYLGGNSLNNRVTMLANQTVTKDYVGEAVPISGEIRYTGTVTNADLNQYSVQLLGEPKVFKNGAWIQYLPANYGLLSFTRNKTSANYKRPPQTSYFNYLTPGDWYTGQWTAQKYTTTPYVKNSNLNFSDWNNHYDGSTTYNFGTPIHVESGVPTQKDFEYCMGSAIFRFRDVTGGLLSNPYVSGTGSHKNSSNKIDLSVNSVSGQATVANNAAPEVEIFGPTANYTLSTVRVVAQDGSTITFPAINVSLACNTTKIFDIPGPTLNVSSPGGELVTNALSTAVAGRAFSGSTIESVTVNGVAAPLTPIAGGNNNEVAFTYDLALADGRNTINIIATDVSGAQAQDQIIVSVDRWLPIVSITPTTGTRIPNTEPNVPVTVQAADRGYGYTFEVYIDGVMVHTAEGAANDITPVQLSYSSVLTSLALGDHTITAVATDKAGNNTSTTVTFVVYHFEDNTPPIITRIGPAAITVEAGSSYADAGATATDDIEGDITDRIVTVNPVITTILGEYTVRYNVSDSAGNPAPEVIRTVSVVDSTPPVLTIPADKIVEATAPLTPVVIGQATATDFFPVTITNNAPASYPVGTTLVTWSATDSNGKTTTQQQRIIVVDTIAPIVTPPSDLTVNATGTFTALNIGTATATDAVGVISITSTAPAEGYQLGTTVVTWIARDAAGNIGTASQRITVVQPPVLNGLNNQILEATSASGAPASFDVTATSACTAEQEAAALSAPNLNAQSNSTTTTGSAGKTFQWGAVTNADGNPAHYLVQISNTLDFTTVAYSSPWQADTSWTQTLPVGTWYWRVIARDSVETAVQSAPAVGNSFTVQNNGASTARFNVYQHTNVVWSGGVYPNPGNLIWAGPFMEDWSEEVDIDRSFITFDTSSLGTGATVTSAKLYLDYQNRDYMDDDSITNVYESTWNYPGSYSTFNNLGALLASHPIPVSQPFGLVDFTIRPDYIKNAGLTKFALAAAEEGWYNADPGYLKATSYLELTYTTPGASGLPAPTLTPQESSATSGDSLGKTFQWSAVAGTDGDQIQYLVEISSNANFSTVNHSSQWQAGTTWTQSLQVGTWYWRVTARDSVHTTVLSSAASSFSITHMSPPVPTETTVTCSADSGATFPLGTTTVTCNATDPCNLSAAGNFTIQVRDTTPPALVLPADIVVDATSVAGTPVTFSATATDIVDPSPAVACSPASGNAFLLGATTVTCTATDASGNTIAGSFNVTAVDAIPPDLAVPADKIVEATGPLTFVEIGQATAADNLPVTISNNAPANYPVGTTIVTWTATDANGNVTAKQQKITVQDTTPPTLAGLNNLVIESVSSCSAPASFSVTAADIVDAAPVVTCTAVSGSSFTLGEMLVTCTATDANNNTATGTFTVKVQDTTAPVLTVPANKTVEATGSQTAVEIGQATADDSCPPVTITNNAPATFPVGTTVVTWTATDANGNASTKNQTITVQDTTAPVLVGLNNLIIESLSSCSAPASFTVTAADTVDAQPAVICTVVSGSSFTLGEALVTCTATDASNNTATGTFTVKVQDTTAPVLTVPADKTVEATGPQTVVELGQATADDSCTPVAITNNAPATFPVGTTVVTWTATDANGNTSTNDQRIVVQDTIPPVLAGLDNLTIEAGSSCSAPASFTVTATDNIDANPAVTCSAVSGSTFALGETIVNCTATDASGNTTSGTFVVKVVDTTAPELTIPTDKSLEATASLTPVDIGMATTSDSCPPVTVTNNAPAAYPVGTTTVVWTATDANGNVTTKEQKVVVNDTTPPVLVEGPDQVVEATSPDGATATFTVTASDLADTTPAVTCSSTSGSTFPLGTTTVTCTATDRNGNTATDSFTVKVQDTTPPDLTVPATITVILNTPLSAPAVQQFLNGATAVDIVDVTPTITHDAPSLNTVGTKVVTFTAVDDFGNTTTKTAVIKVIYGCGDTYLNNEETNFSTPVTLLKPFKLGSTIPVKLHLCDANGMDVITASPRLYVQRFSGDEPIGEPIEVSSTSGADTGNYFRALGNMYMYNLATKPLMSGIYQLQAVLDDGTTRVIPLALKQ